MRQFFLETEDDAFELEDGFVNLFNGRDLTGWGFREKRTLKPRASFDGKTSSDDGRYVAKNGRLIVTTPPEGRRAVFVGDLVDRGPRTPDVLRLVMSMVEAGTGLCVRGNHDEKLLKWMNGRKVRIAHGLAESIEQIEAAIDQLQQRAERRLALQQQAAQVGAEA